MIKGLGNQTREEKQKRRHFFGLQLQSWNPNWRKAFRWRTALMSKVPHGKQFKLNMKYLDHREYFTQKAMVQRVITNRVDLPLPERRVWAH